LPKPEEAWDGVAAALRNSRRHLKASELLILKRYFGPGSALAILSMEELAKAQMLAMLAMGFPVDVAMLRQALMRHDARHVMMLSHTYTIGLQNLAVLAGRNILRRHHTRRLTPELRKQWIEEIILLSKQMTKRGSPAKVFGDVLDLLANASAYKNAGLYVDFRDSKWPHPGQVSMRRAVLSLGIAKGLLKRNGSVLLKAKRIGFRAAEAEIADFDARLHRLGGLEGEAAARAIAEMAFRNFGK
jgi:AbiV family abortive infection protein